MDMKYAVDSGFYNVIGDEIDDAYIKCVLGEKMHLGEISEDAKNVSIVYSAFHGTGYQNGTCWGR